MRLHKGSRSTVMAGEQTIRLASQNYQWGSQVEVVGRVGKSPVRTSFLAAFAKNFPLFNSESETNDRVTFSLKRVFSVPLF